ncbi:hypothetical protein [Marinomonas sp. 2405UD68-3]|uniref:hypothetical protein n=1 Tax=Marinomonas sp. 2405UD68-3 TaxID=3391835 RepID=UPI0039C9795D
MGLFSSKSKKTTNNYTQSSAAQSQLGDAFSSTNGSVNVTTLDGGAVAGAMALADKVVAQNQMHTEQNSAASIELLQSTANNNATLAGMSIDNSAALAAAGMEALAESQAQALAASKAQNEAALKANSQIASQAIAQSGRSMQAISEFANESFERVADSSDTAVQAIQETSENAMDQANVAFSQSLTAITKSNAESQIQMGDVLTDALTHGQSSMQESSQKMVIYIAGFISLSLATVFIFKGR